MSFVYPCTSLSQRMFTLRPFFRYRDSLNLCWALTFFLLILHLDDHRTDKIIILYICCPGELLCRLLTVIYNVVLCYRLFDFDQFLFFIHGLKYIFLWSRGPLCNLINFVISRNYIEMLMFSRFSAWFWADMLGIGFRISK